MTYTIPFPYIVLLSYLDAYEAVTLNSSKLFLMEAQGCRTVCFSHIQPLPSNLSVTWGSLLKRERSEYTRQSWRVHFFLLFLYLFQRFVFFFNTLTYLKLTKTQDGAMSGFKILILLHLLAGLCLHNQYMCTFMSGTYLSVSGRKLGT